LGHTGSSRPEPVTEQVVLLARKATSVPQCPDRGGYNFFSGCRPELRLGHRYEAVQIGAWRKWFPALTIYAVIAGLSVLAGQRRTLAIVLILMIVLSGWAFFGHLITLDDDAPGGWSNPNKSGAIWRASLLQLLLKGTVFAVIATLAAWALG
jgi:hypothetical protein